MITTNINGYDCIDRREIEKHYKLSRTMVLNRINASGIKPVAYYDRYFYPLIEVLDYFDAMPTANPGGRPKQAKNAK